MTSWKRGRRSTSGICLEFAYRHLIDVGSLDGERALHVKHLLPDVAVIGLDISPNYRDPQVIDGVTFQPFTLDFFRQHRGNAVATANIALTYFPPAELLEFFPPSGKTGTPWRCASRSPFSTTMKICGACAAAITTTSSGR